MVLNDHDVSHFEILTKTSRGICYNNGLHTHQLEDPHGERDLEKFPQKIQAVTHSREPLWLNRQIYNFHF